jgi:hypothetical protein
MVDLRPETRYLVEHCTEIKCLGRQLAGAPALRRTEQSCVVSWSMDTFYGPTRHKNNERMSRSSTFRLMEAMVDSVFSGGGERQKLRFREVEKIFTGAHPNDWLLFPIIGYRHPLLSQNSSLQLLSTH